MTCAILQGLAWGWEFSQAGEGLNWRGLCLVLCYCDNGLPHPCELADVSVMLLHI